MDVLVKNFGGVARAAFHSDGGITFVAGKNGAGKTSILTAVGLTLARKPCAVTDVMGLDKHKLAFLKRDYGQHVKEGEEGAEVEVSVADGKGAHLSWPSGEVSATGDAPYSNIIAAGLAKFGEVSASARKSILIDVLKADPTFEEVSTELKDDRWPETHIKKLWEAVEKHGWDGAHDEARTRVTEAKGAWQHITGEQRWGPRKAKDWVPPEWHESLLNMDAEQLKRDAAAAVQERDKFQREVALLERKVADDQEFIDKIGERESTLTKQETRKVSLVSEIEELETDLAKLPNPEGDSGAKCPSCKTNLKAVTEGGFLRFEVYEPPADKGEYDRQLKTRNKVKKDLAGLRSQLSGLATTSIAIERAIKTGKEAAETIEADREKLEKAKQHIGSLLESSVVLTGRARAVDMHKMARDKNREIMVGEKTIDVLKPDGLRRRVLMGRMAEFNKTLAKLSATAKWGAVKVDGNFVLRLEGRHYAVLSGAEKMAADITTQIAVALHTKASMIVIDNTDTFMAAGRNQLFTLLSTCNVPSLVGMAGNKPGNTPDLQKMNMGHTYWVEKGVMQPLDQVLER